MRNREGGKQRTRRVRQKKRQCDRKRKSKEKERRNCLKKIGVAMERVRIMVIERARITLKRKKAEQRGKNEGKSESRK